MNTEQQDARRGFIAVVAALFLLPFVVAFWLAGVGWMATAWWWMVSAVRG